MFKLKLSAQEGRALALTLIVLAVGCLLIPPFLSYISTNLFATRATEDGMKAFYAADGGVERGIAGIMTENYTATTTLTDVVLNKLPVTVTIEPVGLPITYSGPSEITVEGDDFHPGSIGGRQGYVYVITDAITGTITANWASSPDPDDCPEPHAHVGWILALYEGAPIRPTSGITTAVGKKCFFPSKFDPLTDWSFSPITYTVAADCPFTTISVSAPATQGTYSILFYNGVSACGPEGEKPFIFGDETSASYATTGVVTDSLYIITSTASSTVINSYVKGYTASEEDVTVVIDGITRTFSITPTVDIKSWQIGSLSP